MNPEVTHDVVDMVTQGVEKFGKSQDFEVCSRIVKAVINFSGGFLPQKMSQYIKESCDKKFGPSWHCCIGEGFSYDVTAHQKHCLYMMYAGYLGVVVWKC